MRRYYSVDLRLPFPKYAFECVPITSEHKQRINEFQKKYIRSQSPSSICIVWPRFLREPIWLADRMYIYEENGLCYEFFTGIQIGAMVESKHYQYIKGFSFCIEIRDTEACKMELTASQFAYDVKKLMKHQDKIKAVLRDYFDIIIAINEFGKKIEHCKREKEDFRNKRRNGESADWLDDYINNRNK